MSNHTSRHSPIGLGPYLFITWLSGVGASTFLMGAFFWTRQRYQFTDTENLLLNSIQGIAIFTSLYGGRLGDRIGYHKVLKFTLIGMATTLCFGWIPTSKIVPYVLFFLMMVLMGPTWPTLEACVSHALSEFPLQSRAGLYNLQWAGGFFSGFFLSGFLVKWKLDSIVWMSGLFYLAAWIWLMISTRSSASVGIQGSIPAGVNPQSNQTTSEVDRTRARKFMRFGWLGNGCNFLLLAGFTALAPSVTADLNLQPSFGIWLACTFLLARCSSFFILWQWQGWKYRMPLLQVGLWLAPLALSLVFFSGNVVCAFLGLAIFGFTAAISYSGSLFYSLEYGKNKGKHSGRHESIIGGGFFAGSFVGALGAQFLGNTRGAELALVSVSILIATMGYLWITLQRKQVETDSD